MAAKTLKNHPVYDKARAARGNDGRAYLQTADVASLIRSQLAKHFPGVKFSVRSKSYSGGSSINVSWTDGPMTKDVEKIAKPYSFGGFDGMIDLAYSKSHWLYPDGSISLAHSQGTVGSMGSHDELTGDPQQAQTVLVYGGTDCVFCNRDWSDAEELRLATLAANRFGYEIQPNVPYCSQLVHLSAGAEYLTSLMHREASGYYDR